MAQAFPLDPVLYYSRGWDFYNRQDYDRAISEYNEAIKLEPHNATYYFARGVAYLDTNDYDKAISDFNEAIRLEPNNASAYNNRGTAYDVTESTTRRSATTIRRSS
jgi:Flp pilus assembly protein TadD